jgi:hypothetical protein
MEVDDAYAGAPPRLRAADAPDAGEDAAEALSLEERFAGITQALMRDEVDVAEALLGFQDACAAHVDRLRCAATAAAAAAAPAAGAGHPGW